jgi:hypothetical protein
MNLGKAPDQGTMAVILVTAIISTLLVGVFGKKVAEGVLALILKPIKFLSDLIYSYIAPRNPFSISLRTYRKHVLRSNLTRMENPVGPTLNVPLEYAFAPLKLRSSTTQETIDLFTYAAATQRCMVLGGPGTGKTTLMKSLVTSVLKKRCHPDLNGLIPVFVVLRNLAKKQHTVQQAIVAALADYHFPGSNDFVNSALGAGRMIVILDGLDEVGSSREFVVDQIQAFCQYDSQSKYWNRTFVTCREYSYRTMDLHDVIPEVVQVEPFANHHMRIFLEGWPIYRGRAAITLYALIQGDYQIRDICRNPLLLTILTGLYLDSDNFELPSSRDLFYQNAIDELLLRRPARRQIKQTFNAVAKRQILERVALERLETVSQAEDPEELTRESLQRWAIQVINSDKLDINDLLAELVDINGIIKPMNDASYTCAHRTIQEYLAAREARRSRNTHEVVAAFGARPELIQVLYFYCSLLENLPALADIGATLFRQGRFLESGRALVYMKEAPATDLVQQVATELRASIERGVEVGSALEVLSSLANRRDPGFEPAKPLLTDAIDRLAASNDLGASALESAIATSPEIALSLIPGMLRHSSERWKAAGVQLLRDIGTDEALDQLVQLIYDGDAYVRARAGRALAGILKSRNGDLRKRASLVRERRDNAVWPLEAYFPGSIAIPIAEALAGSEDSGNGAIDCAIRAVKLGESAGDEVLRKWRRVPRDLKLQRYRYLVGQMIKAVGIVLGVTALSLLVVIQCWASMSQRAVVVTVTTPHITTVDGHLIDAVIGNAKTMLESVRTSYPSKALGWARILPWHWKAVPALPEGKTQAFERLKELSLAPIECLAGAEGSSEFGTIVASAKEHDLERASIALRAQISRLDLRTHLSIYTDAVRTLDVIIPVLLGLLFLLYRGSLKSRLAPIFMYKPFIGQYIIFLVAMPMTVIVGSFPIRFALGSIPIGCFLVGLVVARLQWPKNRYLATVSEVVESRSRLAVEEESGVGGA